jgi:cell filamentation protein
MADRYTGANGVLVNRWGITDARKLAELEYRVTTMRAREILSGKVDLGVTGYGLERLKAIHGHLFQDAYEWSGKTRTTSLRKSTRDGTVSIFAEPVAIEPYWKLLEKDANAFAGSKGLSVDQKQNALSYFCIEANKIHSFPEGNGRSLQVFMRQLAREQQMDVDFSKVDPREWNRASAVSGFHMRQFEGRATAPEKPDPEPMKKIFREIAQPVKNIERDQQIKEPGIDRER